MSGSGFRTRVTVAAIVERDRRFLLVEERAESGELDPDIVGTHWRTRAEISAVPRRLRNPIVLRCVDDYLAGVRLPRDVVVQVGAP
jgi:hypothetical protein